MSLVQELFLKKNHQNNHWKCHEPPLPWDLLADRPSCFMLFWYLFISYFICSRTMYNWNKMCRAFWGGFKCFRPVLPPSGRLHAFLANRSSLKILHRTCCWVTSNTSLGKSFNGLVPSRRLTCKKEFLGLSSCLVTECLLLLRWLSHIFNTIFTHLCASKIRDKKD